MPCAEGGPPAQWVKTGAPSQSSLQFPSPPLQSNQNQQQPRTEQPFPESLPLPRKQHNTAHFHIATQPPRPPRFFLVAVLASLRICLGLSEFFGNLGESSPASAAFAASSVVISPHHETLTPHPHRSSNLFSISIARKNARSCPRSLPRPHPAPCPAASASPPADFWVGAEPRRRREATCSRSGHPQGAWRTSAPTSTQAVPRRRRLRWPCLLATLPLKFHDFSPRPCRPSPRYQNLLTPSFAQTITIKMGHEDAVYLAKLAEQAERYEGTYTTPTASGRR